MELHSTSRSIASTAHALTSVATPAAAAPSLPLDATRLASLARIVEQHREGPTPWAPGHFDARRDARQLEALLSRDPTLRGAVEAHLGAGIDFRGAIDGRMGAVARPGVDARGLLGAALRERAVGGEHRLPSGVAAALGDVGVALARGVDGSVAHATVATSTTATAATATASPAASDPLGAARAEARGAAAPGSYAFLDDPSLSTSEKVLLFVGTMLQGIHREQEELMRTKAQGDRGAGGAGGAGNVVGQLVGGVASTLGTIFGGPLGGMVGGLVGQAVNGIGSALSGGASGAPGASGGATSASGGGAGGNSDDLLNVRLQNLTQRQQQVMTMASNVLASLHQTAMTPLNNLRG